MTHIPMKVIHSIEDSLRKTYKEINWKQMWNRPDPNHHLPKLTRKEGIQLFTSILDLYSGIVDGYEHLLMIREEGDYTGCTLNQMFRVNDFIGSKNRMMQGFLNQFVYTQVRNRDMNEVEMFSNFISSRIDLLSSTHSQSFDFPIIFFDRYLTMIQRPFQDRFSHLQRVLYQKSNRVILIAISSLGDEGGESIMKEPSISMENEIIEQMEQDEQRRICESVLTNWMKLVNEKWRELGIFGSNVLNYIQSLPVSESLKIDLMKIGEKCFVCERVRSCRSMTADCYCNQCESSIEVVVNWDSFTCPYCGTRVTPKLIIVNGIRREEVEEIQLLTPKEVNEISQEGNKILKEIIDEPEEKNESDSVFYSSLFLTSLFLPFPVFSRLDVVNTAIDILPTSILSSLFQLEAIVEDCGDAYEFFRGYIGDSLLRLRGVNVEKDTSASSELSNWNELIENVSVALLTMSPNRERE